MSRPRTIYVVAMDGFHGCNLFTGECGYYSYQQALERVKVHRQNGSTTMKVWTITMQDRPVPNEEASHVESV